MTTVIGVIRNDPPRSMDSEQDKRFKDAGLGDWYGSLSPEAARVISRYTESFDASDGPKRSLLRMAQAANAEENHKYAIFLADSGLALEGDDFDHFLLYEEMINAHTEIKRLEEAKTYCEKGLELIPKVIDQLREANNGTLPKNIACRNRLIDIVVGLEGDYDTAEKILNKYLDLGLIDKEEMDHRVRSLKIHRLQRTLDSVFSVRFK